MDFIQMLSTQPCNQPWFAERFALQFAAPYCFAATANSTDLPTSPQDETVALIRRITEDDELTNEEVFDLAEFLNDNEEACLIWPGDVLQGALLNVFEDGKTDPDEHTALSELIMKIERECPESDEHTVFEGVKDDDGLEFPTTDLGLPEIDRTLKSEKDKRKRYEMNLSTHSCLAASAVERRTRDPGAFVQASGGCFGPDCERGVQLVQGVGVASGRTCSPREGLSCSGQLQGVFLKRGNMPRFTRRIQAGTRHRAGWRCLRSLWLRFPGEALVLRQQAAGSRWTTDKSVSRIT